VSLSAADFSFIAEDNLSLIFNLLAKHHVKMNLMQNAAISFSLCTDNPKERTDAFLNEMKKHFTVLTNSGLDLLTIRHYTDKAVGEFTKGKEILLEQKTRHTVQLVLRG
jgi:aspartate kinase